MKRILYSVVFLLLTSCAMINYHPQDVIRAPANNALPPDENCLDLTRKLMMTKNYKENLNRALIEKKLISMSDKRMVLNRPHQKILNNIKRSFILKLRNWNNHRYPSFYTFDDEDVIPTATLYSEYLEKMLTNQIPEEDGPILEAFNEVNQWIKTFSHYKEDLNELLDERISLQYNLKLLKKVKLQKDEVREILFTTKVNGEFNNEIIKFREEDENLDFVINKFQKEIDDIDESLESSGKLKERIIRQALLKEMLTIVHRELEHVVENTPIPNRDVINELNHLSILLNDRDYAPSSFGVYKIQDKLFINELRELPTISKIINTFSNPLSKIKSIADKFFADKKGENEERKIGLFKRVYIKVTHITPKQAAIAGGSVALVGLGFDRYFSLKSGDGKTNELDKNNNSKEQKANQAHQEQLNRTKEDETKKQEGLRTHLETLLNKLIN